MRLFEKGKKPVSITTKAREVYDVSGAGDAVISAFTLSLAAGATKRQSAEIANFAGGIVVGKMGAAPVTKKELMMAIAGKTQ
jgi:D-beta-D-heptose 7-phosphate kinase/D-beta-D-heptose 1-phosphate adenosyltransferase